MSEDDSNMLTTSFLDVITCGLGSILLLFFLMAAIKGEMQFGASTRAELTQTDRAPVPLIVMVTGQDSLPIWAQGVAQPWQAPEANFDHKWVVGRDYAILYAAQLPPHGWTLKVGPFAANARISVQVISEGRRALQATNVEMRSIAWRDGDWLSLWPLPEVALP
jgi:hypothetical protein